jgi:Protein of unknown function (DUF4011)
MTEDAIFHSLAFGRTIAAAAVNAGDSLIMDEAYGKDTALTALENLRQRLLDLTARNRLIHFRHTKGTTLRVIDELPDELAEMLLTEKELRFLSIPEPT